MKETFDEVLDESKRDVEFFHEEMKDLLKEYEGVFPVRTIQYNQDDENQCMIEVSDAEDGLMTPHQDKESGLVFYVTNNDAMYELQIQTIVMNGKYKGKGTAKLVVETLLEFFGPDRILAVTLTDQSKGWWKKFAESHSEYPWNIEDD